MGQDCPVRVRAVLTTMAALQVLWLASIWQTGTAASPWKLPPLLGYSLLCPLIVASLPAAFLTKTALAERLASPAFLSLALLVIALMGGMYAYLQSGWPDETLVFAAAQQVVEPGISSFFANYAQIPWLGTQHPPLAVLIYGSALWLFGPSLFIIRLVALVFSVGILFLTYRIGCELYDRTTGIWAAGALLVTPFFFRIGTTALNDVPLTFCFILTVFLTLRLVATPNYKLALGMGLSIGAGLLCKYTMLLVYPVVLIAALLSGQWRQLLSYLLVTLVLSLYIFDMWLVFALQLGVFNVQLRVLSTYATYVVATNAGKRWLLAILGMRLPSGIGMYLLPPLFLGVWQMFRQRSRADLFVLLWILAVFLPLMLTLPGPRYFFPAFPALAIAIARGMVHVGEERGSLVLFALLSWGGALYLFVDWQRAAGGLFVH
jgi:4-amino-4-deoxy-L-arabinose transferase-like glycosyltransferase